MKLFQDIWTWLDGKKTILAVVAMFIGKTLTGLETDVIGTQVPAIDTIVNICNSIATYLGILGIGHKAVKANGSGSAK